LLVDRDWCGYFSGAVRRTAALLIQEARIHPKCDTAARSSR
jgi:hypothetical protein